MSDVDEAMLGPLARLLRRARWLDEPARQAGGFEVADSARLDGVTLLLVAARSRPSARYFVPVLTGAEPARADGITSGELAEAGRTERFDRVVVEAMRRGARLPTARGNVIEFDGTPPAHRATLEFDPGWSSNALSMLDLGGTRHLHKTYRRLAGTREPELLRLMASSGHTQPWAGGYSYLDRATGRREPLGVVYAYAEGDSLDLPLRHSIRAMWPLLHQGVGVAEAIDTVQRDLAAPLVAAGAFLRGFHDELARRLGVGAVFPISRHLPNTDERVKSLCARIAADERHPEPVRLAVVAALETESAALGRSATVPVAAGPCHGDLHLSHFLRRETPDGWRMCLIDLSTPDDDGQSPWQDLVALLRGLEIFTADEFAHQAAIDLGLDSGDTCRTALLLTAGQRPDTPGWTPERLRALRLAQEVANTWAARVRERLLAGYTGQPGQMRRHPAWRMLRLRRLLHELDYAYAHDRAYHAAINLRHALRMREE